MKKLPSRHIGFTLIELLVAILIFSLLSIAGYRGLQGVLDTRAHLDKETRKYQDISQYFSRLQGQLAQASHRAVHTADGLEQAAFVGVSTGGGQPQEAQLFFTRGGGKDASNGWVTPQRMAYRLRNQSIELLRWDHLDQAPTSKPQVDVVLQGVREFNLRFMSASMVWEKQWLVRSADTTFPKALEVELILISGEKVVRVFDLP